MRNRRQYHSAYTADSLSVDRKFNSIMAEDVKVLIAEAFLSLESGMGSRHPDVCLSEYEVFLVEEKASRMKQEISDFIDSQKQRIMDASKARERNGFPVPE